MPGGHGPVPGAFTASGRTLNDRVFFLRSPNETNHVMYDNVNNVNAAAEWYAAASLVYQCLCCWLEADEHEGRTHGALDKTSALRELDKRQERCTPCICNEVLLHAFCNLSDQT